MKPVTLPSLLYLWDRRTLYIGPLFEPINLSQGAATLAVSLDNPFSFQTAAMNKPVYCRSLLLSAGQSITVNTGDAIVANCHLDALGTDYHALISTMEKSESGIAYQAQSEDKLVKGFRDIYETQPGSEQAYEKLDSIIEAVSSKRHYDIDSRIIKIIEQIKDSVDDNLSVEDLAQSVNLSVPRLVQLFKKQTGVPIRRYRLWHRLYVTAVRMGWGESLTQAAIAAGFTDSAHCTHSFRLMLGMKPSLILTQSNGIRIIAPKEMAAASC